MSQKLILVDKSDNFMGYTSLDEAHLGQGKHHRAFVTIIIDPQNNIILQRRKHRIFNGLWDLTAISHSHSINGKDENYQQASDRALKKEMGIDHVPIEKVGGFNYQSFDGKYAENEYCAILIGYYNGKLRVNSREIYRTKRIKFEKFIKDIKKNPQIYTPWAQVAAKSLKTKLINYFKEDLDGFLKIFEPYSRKYFREKVKKLSTFPPLIRKFYEDLYDFTLGGKRLRAFLVYLGYKTAGGKNLKKILPVSLAVEVIHSFLLIHDDIIDKSDLRRGKLTIHKRYEKFTNYHYGQSQAIIIGDIACIEAIKLITSSSFNDKLKRLCLEKLINVILETAYGEALDVYYAQAEKRIKVSLKDVWQITDLKTARYSFVGPLTIGVTLATSKMINFENLREFGHLVGQAFQLQDDILGVFGNEKLMGKSNLSDLREGKNSLLIFKTLELANIRQKQNFLKLWGKKDTNFSDLQKVKKIIMDTGAFDWCCEEKLRLINLAQSKITTITSDSKLRTVYKQLSDFVVNRES